MAITQEWNVFFTVTSWYSVLAILKCHRSGTKTRVVCGDVQPWGVVSSPGHVFKLVFLYFSSRYFCHQLLLSVCSVSQPSHSDCHDDCWFMNIYDHNCSNWMILKQSSPVLTACSLRSICCWTLCLYLIIWSAKAKPMICNWRVAQEVNTCFVNFFN